LVEEQKSRVRVVAEVAELVEDAKTNGGDVRRRQHDLVDQCVAVRSAGPPIEREEVDTGLGGPGDVLGDHGGRCRGVLAEQRLLRRGELRAQVLRAREISREPQVVMRADQQTGVASCKGVPFSSALSSRNREPLRARLLAARGENRGTETSSGE